MKLVISCGNKLQGLPQREPFMVINFKRINAETRRTHDYHIPSRGLHRVLDL